MYLYKPSGSTSYEQYVVIEGTKVLLGTTDIDMDNYYTITQADAKFVLKYDGILASGEDTTAMFEHVNVPTTITNATSDAFGAITIVAQAIQADGFDSWEDAFTAFDAE